MGVLLKGASLQKKKLQLRCREQGETDMLELPESYHVLHCSTAIQWCFTAVLPL